MKIQPYIQLVLSFICGAIVTLILTKNELNYEYTNTIIVFISAVVIPSVVHYENNKKR